MTIWVNEQIDACGILQACIACCDRQQAEECYKSFNNNLTETQKANGWQVRLRSVNSWDEVPVAALKLN